MHRLRLQCKSSGLLQPTDNLSLKGISVISVLLDTWSIVLKGLKWLTVEQYVCLGTYVSVCLSVQLHCASPVFHPTVLRSSVGCLLYRIGSKSVSMLFEALLLALSKPLPPFLCFLPPPSPPILHLSYIWTLWYSLLQLCMCMDRERSHPSLALTPPALLHTINRN